MSNSLSSIPSVNPELSMPFCDTAKSDNQIPQYCISGKHSGDCLSCNLSSGGVDCQGHEIFLSWDEPQAEPASTNFKSDIFNSLDVLYQDIKRLLDKIIQQMAQMEAI
jgi:hypothetical protein